MATPNAVGFLSLVGLLALSGCGMGGADPEAEAAVWQEAFPTFTRHAIPFEGGSYSSAFDVDGDGRLDIVVLPSGGQPLVWYQNPTWERFEITGATDRNIMMAPYDIDADGDLDIAIASEFALNESTTGGHISWVENPGDPTENQDWTIRQIDAVPASHRIRWGDIDGDGTRELINLPIVGIGAVAPEYVGPSQLIAYWIPADVDGSWPSQVLDNTHLEVAHGIQVVDWDGDEAEDILTASQDGVMLFQPALRAEPRHIGAGVDAGRPNRGSSEVSLGSLGGQRFVATIDPWHGTDAVIYTPGDSENGIWSRQVIGTDFEGGHGLVATDLNGDGYDEIVGGGRAGGGSLIIYRYIPDSMSWDAIPLEIGGVTTSSAEAHDLDGDGDQDILVMGGASGAVVWFENSM